MGISRNPSNVRARCSLDSNRRTVAVDYGGSCTRHKNGGLDGCLRTRRMVLYTDSNHDQPTMVHLLAY